MSEAWIGERLAEQGARISDLEKSGAAAVRSFRRIVLTGTDNEKIAVRAGSGDVATISFYNAAGTSLRSMITARSNGGFTLDSPAPTLLAGSSTEKLRLQGGTGNNNYITFYNTAGSTRQGYIQHDGDMKIAADSGSVLIGPAGSYSIRAEPTGRYVLFGKVNANQIADRGIEVDEDVGRVWITHDHTGNVANIAMNRVNASARDSGSPFLQFNRSGTAIGSVTVRSDNAGVNYNQTSDARLKEVLGRASGCLARIRAVAIERYRWIASGREAYGPIAQALHEVIPQAVTVGGDDPVTDPWMVDMGATIPDLIGAVQELADAIEYLQEVL